MRQVEVCGLSGCWLGSLSHALVDSSGVGDVEVAFVTFVTFGPRGEWMPGGDEEALLVVSGVGSDEQAAADEGAQVEGGGAVNRGVLSRPGGGARTGEHDGAAGMLGEADQLGEAAVTFERLADVESVDDGKDGFGAGDDLL